MNSVHKMCTVWKRKALQCVKTFKNIQKSDYFCERGQHSMPEWHQRTGNILIDKGKSSKREGYQFNVDYFNREEANYIGGTC